MKNLTQTVTALRRRLGDSQQAFATRLSLSIRAIGNYEKGRNPTGRALAQLERAATDTGHSDLAASFRQALADELGTSDKSDFKSTYRPPARNINHEILLELRSIRKLLENSRPQTITVNTTGSAEDVVREIEKRFRESLRVI